MPGSSTTPGRPSARAGAPGRVAFHYTDSVGTRDSFSIAAQWLACTFPYRRFADILTDACARLGADVVRYSFIVVDLHHLLLAGLPAHLCENARSGILRWGWMSGGTRVKRFVEGQDRDQLILLPECLDDYVGENNPVRVVDAFVDELDLAALGFEGVVPEATGRPSYHPLTLLKIYLYGYLNRIQSSRRLEREAQRNVELMWLTGRLTPDFKTIADFRKDNGAAIRAVCRQFVAALPQARPVLRGGGRDRRQQVQGGQQPRQELHRRTRCSAGWSRSRRASRAICRRWIRPTGRRARWRRPSRRG